MNAQLREKVSDFIRNLRNFDFTDTEICDLLAGTQKAASSGKHAAAALAAPAKAPAPAKANRLRPAQAAAKPALSTPVARKPAAKRRASRRASKAAPTTSSAPKPASKVTNREWGVFRKDTKNPKATKEDVARAMADPAIRWSLKEALRRKQTAGA